MSEDLFTPVDKKKPKAAPLSEAALVTRLRVRYAPPLYSFMHHVRNQTGYGATTRTADGIAMSLWPSRGLTITGFEIKSSRSDWMAELADPSKAEEIARHCDEWVIVIGDKDIVRAGELPPTWGLLVPKGDGLLMTVEPKQLREPTDSVDRKFLAAILRRVHTDSPAEAIIKAACDKVRNECHDDYVKRTDRDHKHLSDAIAGLTRRITDFEKAAGISIDRWDAAATGEAVRHLKGNTPADVARRLTGIAASIEDLRVSVLKTASGLERDGSDAALAAGGTEGA